MTAPLRLGLVGCGRLAEQGYVPAGARTAAVDIVAVADPDPARRRTIAGLVDGDVSTHADAAALLADAAVDAVVLATPAAHHLADAELAVRRGRPVLVEKPPAPDAAGARALADLGPGVRVAFNRRFDPAVARLRRDLPTSGPLDLDLAITYRRASWSAHVVRDDVVLDLVPHLVDWARWLSRSEVRSVTALELEPDAAVLDLELDRGRATVTAAADRLHEERIEVRGAAGAPLARHRTGGPVGAVTGRARALAGRLRGAAEPHPLAASLAAQLDDFARVVRGDVPTALATAADGVAAMAVVDAARTSAAAGGTTISVHDLREPTC
jgi:myo-inositol 2-dehydrogenase/D-chiro-inositol 1-dehydrogenase